MQICTRQLCPATAIFGRKRKVSERLVTNDYMNGGGYLGKVLAHDDALGVKDAEHVEAVGIALLSQLLVEAVGLVKVWRELPRSTLMWPDV